MKTTIKVLVAGSVVMGVALLTGSVVGTFIAVSIMAGWLNS
jgi:uncharacterized protein YneF (UPF0154 family)